MPLEEIAGECGVDLVGAIRAGEVAEYDFYAGWVERGRAAGMGYLTDRRGEMRRDVRTLLETAQTVVVAGVLYNTDAPYSTEIDWSGGKQAWVSRYAWGDDYHEVVRERLEQLARRIVPDGREYRVCVDTAPLLERSLARKAGLGWIGKNTCLINEPRGSWFFLGEILIAATLEELGFEGGAPPPDRCGTCTACIDACPTQAIVPVGEGRRWEIDSQRCISYHTIESREPELTIPTAPHVFGCDICQDVCPWNRRAPRTGDPEFAPRAGLVAPGISELAAMQEDEFRERFRASPVKRTKWSGWRRNLRALGGSDPVP